MSAQVEEPEETRGSVRPLRRDLAASLVDGTAFAVMVGVGETYLAAFALAVGASEAAAGLVTTVPFLAGAVLQLISPWAVRRLGSYRRWCVLCAAAQGASFLPLVAGAILGWAPIGLLFVCAALYWGAGMATGAAWNTWIGTVVPEPLRAHFFAKRSRYGQVAVLAGLIGGGLVLTAARPEGQEAIWPFAILFAAAFVGRATSAAFLSRQSESMPVVEEHRVVPVREWVARFRHAPDGRLLVYMLAAQVAVQTSAAFFNPFMLEELHFSYWEYTAILSASFVAKALVLPTLGRLSRRFGARRLLWAGGLGIVPLSALWLISEKFEYLVIVQLFAGAAWAAYELGTFLLFFETMRVEEQTSILTTFNFANSSAIVAGSLVGAAILSGLGDDHRAYSVLFYLSAVLRLATVALLFRVTIEPAETVPMSTGVDAIRRRWGRSTSRCCQVSGAA